MSENRQYLRIGLLGVDYLLPNSSKYVIEKREDLEVNDTPDALIAAWQATSTGRAPAYSIDAHLNPTPRRHWQRAVFLQAGGHTLGLIADELQLLAQEDVRVEPFLPLGPAPTAVGQLFGGAWMRPGQLPVLVFEPRALTEYLLRLEEAV